MPIPAVVFILSFIAAITEVPVASLLLRDVNSYTPPSVCSNTSTRKTTCGATFAAAAVLCHPDYRGVLLAQRWLVNGLTAGGEGKVSSVMPLQPLNFRRIVLPTQLVTVVSALRSAIFYGS